MKKILLAFQLLLSGVCIAALNAQNAGEVQDLQYVQGTLNMLELPFPVRSCTFSKNGLVQADVVNGGKTLRINALTTGSTEMQLIGADMMKMYRITVISDLRSMYQSMLHDFEEFPEVEAEISGSRIIIRGDISNLEHWRLFRKYVSFYQGSILNLVKFHPKAEMMLLLNSALESEGYKVVESNGKVLKHGELAITQMGDVMEISGTVYSPADIERITQVINSQNWLSTGGGDDTKVHAVMNVIVVPELMEISAVFVGIDRSYLKDVGSTFFVTGIPINGGFKWNGMSDLHKWTDGGTFRIGTNLETALNIFGANNHSVFRRAGYLTFKSNDDSARTLHDGGQLQVRTNGLNSGSLTSVSYGFQLTIKGGLTGKDSVYMDISVSFSAPVEKPNGDYDVKTQTINTAVFCKLDETVAIGGLRELIRGTSGPTGLPYLRHVPLLNWFFAIQSDNIYDKQSLVLISPRLMSQAKPIEIPPSQELRDTEEEVNIQYREGKKAERRWFEYLRW